MFNLPIEIWLKIIYFSKLKDVIKLAQVNKFFFYLTKQNNHFFLNYQEGFNTLNYFKYISFIKHCENLKYFEDFSLGFKYYISDNNQLFKNKLKTINIRITDKYELNFIKANRDLKNIKLKCSHNLNNYYIFSLFDKLDKLTNIFIDNSLISDGILSIFNKYKLKHLAFENCINLLNFDILIHNNLKSFKIINHQYNNSNYLQQFLKKQKKLEELTLSLINCNYMLADTISNIGKNLKILDLSYPQGLLDDFCVYRISNNCHNLVELNLNGSDITDNAIYFLTRNCPKITKLSIAGTFIRDISLVFIAMYSPQLKYLYAEFNRITRIGIFNLLLRCQKLKKINILNEEFSMEYLNKVYKKISKKNERNLL